MHPTTIQATRLIADPMRDAGSMEFALKRPGETPTLLTVQRAPTGWELVIDMGGKIQVRWFKTHCEAMTAAIAPIILPWFELDLSA